MTFDPLPPDLAAALVYHAGALGPFGRLHFSADVGSTNDVAMSLALAGAPAGTSVLADFQHAGRGRRGREWFSPSDAGLYVSIVLRPSGPERCLPLVTLGSGVAVAQAIRDTCGLPVELKWPNDLVIGRPWRKLGGVLSEATGAGAVPDAVVVGIGVNLRGSVYPHDVAGRATSIEAELGRSIDRTLLVVHVLSAMRGLAAAIDAGDADGICRRWRTFARAGLAGARVWWQDRGVRRTGRAKDVDADGALLVDTADGVTRIVSGDVQWESWSRE